MFGESVNSRGFILVYVLVLAALLSLGSLHAALTIRKVHDALGSETLGAALKDSAMDGRTVAMTFINGDAGRHTLEDQWARISDRKLSFPLPGHPVDGMDSGFNAEVSIRISDEDGKLNLLKVKPEEIFRLARQLGAANLESDLRSLLGVIHSKEIHPVVLEDLAQFQQFRNIVAAAPELLKDLTVNGDGLININTCSSRVLMSLEEIQGSRRAETMIASIVKARPYRDAAEIAQRLNGLSINEKKAFISRIKLKSEYFRVECEAAGADRIFGISSLLRAGSRFNPAGGLEIAAFWETWR